MGPDSVSRLDIWRESVALVKRTYLLTQHWPTRELYGLTAQVRRAAVSIPANLAEGVGRGTPAEAAHFAKIALGSLYELDTLLHLATDLAFIKPEDAKPLRNQLSSLSRRISSFIAYKQSLK